ncbi:O-antigen ligase family protein [Gilvibacter sp.]|uniref:O-antigen ligase family protein n=1 Tax=Gilvibacter sp. TaxID=2729997 RepID=UPI003F49BE0E
MITFYNRFLNDTVLQWLLLGSMASLPLNLFVNNLLFTIFFIAFVLKILLNDPKGLLRTLRQHWVPILLLMSPLLVASVGCIYTSDLQGGLKDLGRLVPLALIIPAVFHSPEFYKNSTRKLGYALALGSLMAALLCWGLSIGPVLADGNGLADLFSQKYAYHELSGRIDIHTPYLGMFTAISIFFLLRESFKINTLRKRFVYSLWMAVLLIFLFNLLARTAILTLVIGSFFFLLHQRKYLLIVLGVLILSGAGTLAYWQDHNFLRDRLFNSLNVFEQTTIFSKKDDRFTRWEASVSVFKQFPILGPGTAAEDSYRKAAYYENLDSKAYNDNYNAHNQFLEYLSTYGLLGGICFVLLLIFLLRAALGDPFRVYLVFAFILAGLTESILERSWGVSLYLLIIMIVCSHKFLAHERP